MQGRERREGGQEAGWKDRGEAEGGSGGWMCEDFKSETRATASQRLCQTCLQQGDSQSVPRLAVTLDRAANSMIAALY